MQTILGAGGSIGSELAKALKDYTSEIKLVSRQPQKINDTDTLFPADLSNQQNVEAAIAGSSVCYLTVGFEYKTKLWQQLWPALIKNVVAACMKHQCKLVFFDNIYALDPDHLNPITETSPINPPGKKGEVRAFVDRHILKNIESGKLEAIIARSPDFFGPAKKENSLLMTMVYNNLAKNKSAQWFCNADIPHSFGFTPDLAKGTAVLGNTPDAYNQIWNLPVPEEALTGRQWVALFAEIMNKPDKVKVFSKGAIKLLGLFIPVLKEMGEMLYQYDRAYVFDSAKFQDKFDFKPASNREAVKQTIENLK